MTVDSLGFCYHHGVGRLDQHGTPPDLTSQERLCLRLIGERGLVAFNPGSDEVLVRLLKLAFIHTERLDDETELLHLTPEGNTAAAGLRHNPG